MRRRTLFVPALVAACSTTMVVAAPAHGPGGPPRSIPSTAAVAPKPAPPISIAYTIGQAPVLGVPVEIRISVAAANPLDDVSVRIGTSEGLVLDTAPGLRAARVSAGEPLEFGVSVTPVEAAVVHVLIDVAGTAGGRPQGRHLSIPLRLGPRKATPAALKPDPATGGRVHAVPARPRPGGRLR